MHQIRSVISFDYFLLIAGYAVQVFDIDPIIDAFSTNGGFRKLICNEARGYGLTGYVRCLRSHHAEVVFEGGVTGAEALYDYLRAQIRTTRMFRAVIVTDRAHRERRLYDSFEIERNASVTCVKGDHSPD